MTMTHNLQNWCDGLFACLFICLGAEDRTKGLAYARQVLHPWATPPPLLRQFNQIIFLVPNTQMNTDETLNLNT